MTDQTVIANSTVVAKPTLPNVPGYHIERLLGKGGMAEVFLGEDETLKRKAAIKMINLEGSMDADFRQRFEDEARTVAGFNHPNIITVYGFGEVEGKQYIAMSFESGGELDDRLGEGTIAKAEALQITAKLAAALAYSHQRGIVHRDIKPANVLFDESGSPILSDFGIAKELNVNSGLTQTGMAIGSPAYMSPEQLMGQKVDGKTDVYSLALVLFQMLHGRLPPNELKMSQDTEQKRGMLDDALGPELADVSEILERCLEFSPEQRPTAGEFAALLQDIDQEQPGGKISPTVLLLGGALVAGVVGMSVLLMDPADTAKGTVNFTLSPDGTTLLVDESLTVARSLDLGAGSYTATLVAPGYQGRTESFNVVANTENNLPLALKPLIMPAEANTQIAAFHTQMGSEVAGDAIDYSEVSYPIYLALLKLKEDQFDKADAQKAVIAERFQQNYQTLADEGDELAQMALLIADSDGFAPLSGAKRQSYKTELGRSSFPLSVFYTGFLMIAEADDGDKIDIDKVRRYRTYMQNAENLGLSLAAIFVAKADKTLRENGAAP